MVDPRRNASNSLKKEPRGYAPCTRHIFLSPAQGLAGWPQLAHSSQNISFRPYPSGFRLIIDPGPVSHGIFAFNRVLAGPRPISEVIPHRFRFIDIVTESPLYEDQFSAAS